MHFYAKQMPNRTSFVFGLIFRNHCATKLQLRTANFAPGIL